MVHAMIMNIGFKTLRSHTALRSQEKIILGLVKHVQIDTGLDNMFYFFIYILYIFIIFFKKQYVFDNLFYLLFINFQLFG